jgi:hypothetical protein
LPIAAASSTTIGQALPLGRQHEQVAEREVGPDVGDVVQHPHPHAVTELLEALEIDLRVRLVLGAEHEKLQRSVALCHGRERPDQGVRALVGRQAADEDDHRDVGHEIEARGELGISRPWGEVFGVHTVAAAVVGYDDGPPAVEAEPLELAGQ